MKRAVAIIVLLAVLCVNASGIFVFASDEAKDAIAKDELELYKTLIPALSADRDVCEAEFGMSKGEHDQSMLGYPIHTYQFTTDDRLEQLPIVCIPVFAGDKEIYELSVSKVPNGTDSIVTSGSSLSARLNLFYGKEIAIIYDTNSMLIVDSSLNCLDLPSSGMVIKGRGDLKAERVRDFADDLSFSKVCGRLKTSEIKGNDGIKSTSSLPLVLLYPPKVLQIDSYICWAACVASIGEYKTGISHSAQYVAKHLYGPYTYNQGADLYDSTSELSDIYGVTYPYVDTDTAPTANQMYNNINSNYPMFGRWMYYYGVQILYHQAVIRGYYDLYGRVYVMDPDNGAYYSGDISGSYYYYTNNAKGVTLRLIGYGSKYN